MNNNQFLSLVGIALKAGKVDLGYDAVNEAILKRRAQLIIFASDLSDGTLKSIKLFADNKRIKTLSVKFTMLDIYRSIGKKVGIICINDRGFSEKLISLSGECNINTK